jgi:flagellin
MGIRASTNVSAISSRFDPGLVRPQSSGEDDATIPGTGPAPVVATALRGMIRSQQEHLRNANHGVALVRTAEGWLTLVSETLGRLRELAPLPDGERGAGDGAAAALVAELAGIAGSAEFGGIRLLDGSTRALRLPVGEGTFLEVALPATSAAALGLDAPDLAAGALPAIDAALAYVATAASGLAAAAEQLARGIAVGSIGAVRGDAPIRDAGEAERIAGLTRERILRDPELPRRAQAGVEPGYALSLLVRG